MKRIPLAAQLTAVIGILFAGCGENASTGTSALSEKAGQTPSRRLIYRDETTEIFKIESPDDPPAYEAQIQARARSGRFRIALELDADRVITRVRVPSYIGDRGREVALPAFTRQFIAKGPAAPLRVGDDIHAVTGATLSARVMTEQIRRTLRLLEQADR